MKKNQHDTQNQKKFLRAYFEPIFMGFSTASLAFKENMDK